MNLQPALPSESTWSRGAWLVLASILTVLLLSFLHLVVVLYAPSDGWNHKFTPSRLVELGYHVSSEPTPLKPGDTVSAIEGVSLGGGMRPRLGKLQVGQTLRYTLTRDNRTFDLQVPLVRTTPLDLLRSMLGPDNLTSTISNFLFMLIGLFVFLLRPGNLAARLLGLLGSYLFTGSYGLPLNNLYTAFFISPISTFLYSLFGGAWIWFVFPTLIALPLSFPQPKRPMRGRFFLLFLYGLPFAVTLLDSVGQALIGYEVGGIQAFTLFGFSQIGAFLIIFPTSLVHSFRTLQDPVRRAQMRWFAFGLIGGIGGAVLVFFSVIFLALVTGQDSYNSPYARWADPVMNLMFLVTPLSLAFAITRYRLFDIDLIIRRTLQYSLLTISLGLIYLGAVVTLQNLLGGLTGERQPEIVTVISTLTIAALFTPLRRRIQAFIDRRFYRRKYNAEKLVLAFSTSLREEVYLDELTNSLVSLVEESMQPEHVHLWLRPVGYRGNEEQALQ